MFDSWGELLVIAVVALVVVGPKELPQLLRTVGRWVGQARRMAGEFQSQVNEAMREADLDDVRKHVDDLRSLSPKNIIASQLASVTDELGKVDAAAQAEVSTIRSSFGTDLSGAPAGAALDAFTVDTAAAEQAIDAAVGVASDAPMPLDPSLIVSTPMPDPAAPQIAEAMPSAEGSGEPGGASGSERKEQQA